MGSVIRICSSKDSRAATVTDDVTVLPHVDSAKELDWVRLGGGELEQPLLEGLVQCVDSRYLVDLFRRGGRIERMQDLPNSAFIGLETLKNLGTYGERIPEHVGNIWTRYEWLPVAILSYSWLGRSHPDPHAETLGVLVKALDLMKPHGVIIDFTSLPQAPRTEEENKRFKEGLQAFNIFYSHPHTLVLQITDFPAGYPSARTYDLPEGHVPARYENRGWCFAEACISSLGKPPKLLCNLSRLPDRADGVVAKCKNELIRPPLSPSAFNDQLAKKAFTQKKTDLERVQQLYSDAFTSRIRTAKTLQFACLQWGPEDIYFFAQVIWVNELVQHCDLSGNNVGETGMITVLRVVDEHRTLKSLKLDCCGLGDAGAKLLGEGLKANTTLAELALHSNQILAEGARALGEGLKFNTTLTKLHLYNNRIRAEGARDLCEGLKVNTTLTTLNLSYNQIGDEGASALGEGLKVNSALTTLELNENEIGDEPVRALSEGLKVNTSLIELQLVFNFVGDEGALVLGEGLKVNTALTKLDLTCNTFGSRGARALNEATAARPGLEVKYFEWSIH